MDKEIISPDAGFESFICPNCNILQGMDRIFKMEEEKGGLFCEDCGYDLEEFITMMFLQ